MYRVAVILNESELLRSGYARVTPKLKRIPRLSCYTFESYTVVDIDELFVQNASTLMKYDSLIITTNATSDVSVHESLKHNREHIERFLQAGKGLFIVSQKKLSRVEEKSDETGFLPSRYEYVTRERPRAETDSGVGSISLCSEAETHMLLRYPNLINAEMVEERCKKNEFRRHFYRSHLEPRSKGTYLPLLQDSSKDDSKPRYLLMVCQAPLSDERIVISSIALDWECHEELLGNIVTFITEGVPKIAFIKKEDVNDGDYEVLLTSARLSKVPHAVYANTRDIPAALADVHNSYIFSSGWEDGAIYDFLSELRQAQKNRSRLHNPYRRVYYLQRHEDALALTQHTLFSTYDVMIDRSVVWLAARFANQMWGKSFWITYDVIQMMYDLDVDTDEYIPGILSDIKKHYKKGSYDGVMGASCGLLELLIKMHAKNTGLCAGNGFAAGCVEEVCAWIQTNYESQSSDDKWTAFLALTEALNSSCLTSTSIRKSIEVLVLQKRNKVEGFVSHADISSEYVSELDVCKYIAVALASEPKKNGRFLELLRNLRLRQGSSGEWSNSGRTAHVLVVLLRYRDRIRSLLNDKAELKHFDEMIQNGILFLRSRYSWDKGSLEEDIQSTAKAVHAIGLFNKVFRHSTQDFLDVLAKESVSSDASNLIRNLSERISDMRESASNAEQEVHMLSRANTKLRTVVKTARYSYYVGVCSTVMLIGIVMYLMLEQKQVLIAALKGAGLWSIMVCLVLTIIVNELLKLAHANVKD